jgi:hypothetical protein
MLSMNSVLVSTIGDSCAPYSKENLTSSAVTGSPSWNVMPSRNDTSMVVSSAYSTLSAAQGSGCRSGVTRINRS